MAGIITFTYRITVLTLYEEYFYTRGRLRRHPLARGLVAEFESFEPRLQATLLAELGLMANRHEGDAAVDWIDVDLDDILNGIAAVSLIESKNDRDSPPYSYYFSTARPSDMRRPVLAAQLEKMRTWPSSLRSSSNPVLVEYGAKLEGKIAIADECEAFQRTAQTALSDFRTLGGRKECVDEFNAKRKALHGKLGEIQHQHPELGTGWADSFFRHGTGSEKPTLREVERRLAAAEEELAALKRQRDELVAQEEMAARLKAEMERTRRLAELEAAKRAAADAAARIAELEAALGEDGP